MAVIAHRCMIVGLKYVGATSDFPTRITVGNVIKLRPEADSLSMSGTVAAYHNGTKVGYLSPNQHSIWSSLNPSTRRHAEVVGEILDEDGNLAALDVEIVVPTRHDRQRSDVAPENTDKAAGRRIALKAGIGFAGVILSLAIMGHGTSTDPNRPLATGSSMTVEKLSKAERSRNMGLSQVVKLMPVDQGNSKSGQNSTVPLELVQSSAREAQAHELDRMIQHAYAYRLSADLKRRSELALMSQQAQDQKTPELAEDLRGARDVIAQQRIQIELWQFKTRKLVANITQLQRRLEKMALAQRQLEEKEKQKIELTELDLEELGRHQGHVDAWNLISRKMQAKTAQQPGSKKDAKAVPVKPRHKPIAKSKRTNFSRYAN
jgi:hypothetical protein